MLKIPKEKIVEKIQAKTDLSVEEIDSKIQTKLKELSGLISEEGAAHIIANELGVPIFTTEPTSELTIGEIYPGMRSITTHGKVMRIYPLRTFTRNGSEGKVQSFVMADSTSQIRCAAWHDATTQVEQLQEGDTIKIENAMSRDNQGRCELSINDNSTITKNPSGIVIDDVAQAPSNAESAYINELQKTNKVVSILGTIVQMYPLTFFVPRAEREEGKEYSLDEKKMCVTNFVLDDGTGTLRCAMFTDQIVEATQKTVEELKQEQLWSEEKDKLMGQFVEVTGRTQYNEQFNRQEIIVNQLTKLDLQQGLEKLQKMKKVSANAE